MGEVVRAVENGSRVGQGASLHAAGSPPPGAGRAGDETAATPSVSRPSVISLAFKEKAALYAAYMRFVDGGGLFIPTTRPAHLGDDIYAIVSLMDEPNKVPIPGKVCWITPAGVPGRQQGIGVQFARNEAGAEARRVIEVLLSGALKSTRPTHTI
jgi:type IV pilus assembly protein PilZ